MTDLQTAAKAMVTELSRALHRSGPGRSIVYMDHDELERLFQGVETALEAEGVHLGKLKVQA